MDKAASIKDDPNVKNHNEDLVLKEIGQIKSEPESDSIDDQLNVADLKDMHLLYDGHVIKDEVAIGPVALQGLSAPLLQSSEAMIMSELRQIKASVANGTSEVIQMKANITYLMRKMETMEQMLTRLVSPSAEPASTPLPILPLMELTQLNRLEDSLADQNAEKQLFTMLRHTGGSKERDCVNRCLEKVFSNYLARFCSWTGKKGNFKLSSLKLMTTIKLAARDTFPELTDESYERHVMKWFQHACTRFKRQE